jgi:hypothetical protein
MAQGCGNGSTNSEWELGIGSSLLDILQSDQYLHYMLLNRRSILSLSLSFLLLPLWSKGHP